MSSGASSTLEVYLRHLRHLATAQYVASDKGMLAVLRQYLATKASTNQASSNMRQIISTCRLCEELELVQEFVPKGIWQMVRGKDRMAGRGQSQGWGSVEVVEAMAKRVQSAEDKLVVALAILSVAFYLRISEAASVRGIDLDQGNAYVRFYDFKTKDRWIKRPAGSYVCRLIGFVRLQMAIQGRSAQLPVFKGGTKKLIEPMTRLLRETEFRDLRWHCWRCAGATMFVRAGGSMAELMAWGRWRSIRVARKYSARWDAMPWTGGMVPWPRIIPGVPTKWRYDLEPFRAKELWPQRHFIRDHDDGWETEGSDANGVGAAVLGAHGACGVSEVVQGAKHTTVEVADGKSGDHASKRSRAGSKSPTVASKTKSRSGEASCEPKRKVHVGQKARASVVPKKDVGSSVGAVREEKRSVVDRVRSLAAKAKESARKGGAGI